MENQQAFEQPPTAVNVTVRSAAPREYLTEREVERLIKAASENRCGHRDATAILIAYRHGMRASELVALRWDDIDLSTGRLHARRAKGGAASVHPIGARESRALRKLQRDMVAAGTLSSPYVFVSERGSPLSCWLSAHGCSGRRSCPVQLLGAQPHAPPWLRLQTRQ